MRQQIKVTSISTVRHLLATSADKQAISLGRRGLKYLDLIARGEDLALAVKAVHIAGATGLSAAAPIVASAARSRRRALKTAAAASARSLPVKDAEPILLQLLKSRDISVRKWAVRSLECFTSEKLRKKLDQVRDRDANDHIRRVADATRARTKQSRK